MPLGLSRDIARALAERGVASYDKRGVGRSGGTFLVVGFAHNIDDAEAALRIAPVRARA